MYLLLFQTKVSNFNECFPTTQFNVPYFAAIKYCRYLYILCSIIKYWLDNNMDEYEQKSNFRLVSLFIMYECVNFECLILMLKVISNYLFVE